MAIPSSLYIDKPYRSPKSSFRRELIFTSPTPDNLLTNVYQPTRGSILIDGMPTAGKKTYQVNRMGVARTDRKSVV